MPRKHDPIARRDRHLMYKYQWNNAIFEHVLLMQGGGCAMCGSTDRLCVDHNHQTGHTRGILCNDCNLTIGYAKDNTTTLENAISYISEHARDTRTECESNA